MLKVEETRNIALYRMVWNVFRHLEPFRPGSWCDRQTDKTAFSSSLSLLDVP